MFAIFRKRASKLSADLEALQDYAAGIIQRAEAHISGARQVINILSQEIGDWSQNAMGSDERFSAGDRDGGSPPVPI